MLKSSRTLDEWDIVIFDPNWKHAGFSVMKISNKWILACDFFILNDKFRCISTINIILLMFTDLRALLSLKGKKS